MFDKSHALFPIKDQYIFLTHCGIAPLYSGALRAEREVAEAQCRTGALVFSRYDAILDGLRDAAAQVMKTSPDNLAFVKNTTEGVGLIANGYPFQVGDNIISYVHEYPANHYPWKLQEKRGVELVLLPDSMPGERPVGWSMRDLEARVTPRTRVVALSHVQFASGYCADLKTLAEFCKTRNIDLVLDVAQSLGSLPIYPEELHAAALVSSGWKWLMGPIGSGLVYTSPSFRQKLDLTMVGAESMQQGTDYLDHAWKPFASAKCFEYSTSPIALAAALEVCLREITLRYGIEAIAGEIFRLQDVFLRALDPTRARPVFTPQEHRSPILSLIVPGHANVRRRALLKQNVICTERGGYLRVAPHFYNTDDEIARAAMWINTFASEPET
jgi:cysteine desulfurase / selenocysteine lyase